MIIIIFILVLIGNILGVIAFGKLLPKKNTDDQSSGSQLVIGENNNPCKYCRGIDGTHYHRIDGKLYKRDNWKKTGTICDLCKNYPIQDVVKGKLTKEQATHVHIVN